MAEPPPEPVKPFDWDTQLCVDAFLKFMGKTLNQTNRRWAIRGAKAGTIPGYKLAREWFFDPRTVKDFKHNK